MLRSDDHRFRTVPARVPRDAVGGDVSLDPHAPTDAER